MAEKLYSQPRSHIFCCRLSWWFSEFSWSRLACSALFSLDFNSWLISIACVLYFSWRSFKQGQTNKTTYPLLAGFQDLSTWWGCVVLKQCSLVGINTKNSIPWYFPCPPSSSSIKLIHSIKEKRTKQLFTVKWCLNNGSDRLDDYLFNH